MQTRKTGRFSTYLMFIALWLGLSTEAQSVIIEREQKTLGSVQVGVHTVSVKIAYEADSALLIVSVPEGNGSRRYIPLIASTYRGIFPFQLDVLSPDTGDEFWIRMSRPQNEILAHYRFGSETALTPFGHAKLLETPFPKYLSGGSLAFPKEGLETARLRASFFHYSDM